MLYAIDTETGRIQWSAEVGEANRPTQRAAGNGRAPAALTELAAVDKLLEKTDTSDKALSQRRDKIVAVVNGTTLYLLNRADGSTYLDPKNNIPWKADLPSSPETGPLVTEDLVYVPTVNGQIVAYTITDSKSSPSMLPISGRCEMPPIQVADRIAWGTDRGIVQITQPKAMSVRHQIETTGPITSMLNGYAPQVFAGSLDGYVYCINENSGNVVWKLTTGSPLRESPIVIRGAVLATTSDEGMFRAAAADGFQAWFNPAPRRFLAASRTKIYALDAFGRMVVLNAKSGATIDSFTMPEAALPVQNGQTDRVFLSSDIGLIQCLHEPELTEPQNYLPPKIEKPAEEFPRRKRSPRRTPAISRRLRQKRATPPADVPTKAPPKTPPGPAKKAVKKDAE